MMRKRIAILLLGAGALLATTAWAMGLRYSSGKNGISVTEANTNTPFTDNHSGGGSAAFNARSVTVCSRTGSANTCYFDLDGVASTADWPVVPGMCVPVPYAGSSGGDGWAGIGAICDTGGTATFDVYAGR